MKKCKDSGWVSGLQFPFFLAIGRFRWTRLEYSIWFQSSVKETSKMVSPTGFLKSRSLGAGLFLPWCHYLQFLDVISVRLIYLSQNGRVYWKRVPQKEFICVFAGVAVWAVTCVLILPAVKWRCLCPTGDSLQTIPPVQQMLCTDRECKGVIFLPSWFLLVRLLWPFPLPVSDLNLILLFFPLCPPLLSTSYVPK